MKTKQHLEQSPQEEQIREALNTHWQASAAGDANAEHDIYDDDAICDYPQSGERILGRRNLQALRSHHPGKPSGFNVKRILGNGDLWVTEYTITYQERVKGGRVYKKHKCPSRKWESFGRLSSYRTFPNLLVVGQNTTFLC